MTAFSAAADSYQPRPSWYSKPAGPADTLTPPMESDQPAQPEQEEPMWSKKPKKKPYHPSKYYPSQTTQDEDEEEYEAPSRSKSNSIALSVLCKLPGQSWAFYVYCWFNGYRTDRELG
ncbi:uncharacterized protein LOC103523325, partial [Diaphorina citri]|uniref:Uncharacterized protein LOC103523325 n=1 Tax=Diaphorina citri TaxID=121845 RepID=A0A1S3DR98_DIACI